MPSFCGIVLAAGESSRMGRDKALLPWQNGTFLEAAVRSLRPHVDLVIVVVGKNADLLRPVVYALGESVIENPAPEQGQFSSLQIGLRETLSRGRDAAIVTLVDRPAANEATVAALKQRFLDVDPHGIWAAVPEYDGRHGHPIVLGRRMVEALLVAPVTSTARDVMHAHQQEIEYLPVADPMVVANVNTPEDFERLSALETTH